MKKITSISIALLGSFLLATSSFAQEIEGTKNTSGCGFCGEWLSGGWNWMFFPFGLFIFFMMIWCFFFMFRRTKWFQGSNWFRAWDGNYREKESPLEIAKRRFASGEITKKEFNDIKNELKE